MIDDAAPPRLPSPLTRKEPVERMANVTAEVRLMSPPDQVMVPASLIVRPRDLGALPVMLRAALESVSIPAPDNSPPDQLNAAPLARFKAAEPVNVPPERLNVPVAMVPPL